jgi:hypothetical protein
MASISIREMTNMEYANSLNVDKMPLVIKVVKAYVSRVVGLDSPIWVKEKTFDEWCSMPYDSYGWERARCEMAGKIAVFDENHGKIRKDCY